MLGFLLNWYNLPFLIVLGGGVLFAMLQLVGGIGDTDAHADIDTDVDIDADLDVDSDVNTHGDIPGFDFLATLGVGRVPLAILLMALLGSLGAIGLLANTLIENTLGNYPSFAFLAVLAGSLIAALALTSLSSSALGRVAAESSTAVGFQQLVGRVGMVSSSSVSSTYGRVSVRDSFGTLHTVYAVTSEATSIPERSEVALVAYDEGQRRFIVRTLN